MFDNKKAMNILRRGDGAMVDYGTVIITAYDGTYQIDDWTDEGYEYVETDSEAVVLEYLDKAKRHMENSRITENQAREFWRDFYGTVFHEEPDPHYTKGIMSTDLIADHMRISPECAEAYLQKAKEIKLTERQGGGWVV